MPLVLIPAYQPDRRLVALVRDLAPRGPVLVVDDGSGPSYAEVFAACAAAGAVVASHPHNRGKGAALRTGLARAARDWPGIDIVTADADGQHTPEDIARVADALALGAPPPALVGVARGAASLPVAETATSAPRSRPQPPPETGATRAASTRVAHVATSAPRSRPQPPPEAGGMRRGPIVLGVRAFSGRVPLRSRAGNALTRRAFRLATGRDVSDTQTGLRGFPSALVPWLLSLPGDRFEYEFHMLLAAPAAGVELVEVPIRTVYLDGNASSHFRPLADSARIYAPLLRFTASALLAFVVDTLLLLVLQAVTGWLLLSVALARVASAGLNFAVNRRVVFRAGRSLPVRTAALRYASLAALLLAASYGMLTALTDAGLATLLAKLLTDLVLFAVSFSVQRAVVFAPEAVRRPNACAGMFRPRSSL